MTAQLHVPTLLLLCSRAQDEAAELLRLALEDGALAALDSGDSSQAPLRLREGVDKRASLEAVSIAAR